ncbi:histidine--tRNA ligase [Paenibacillus hodogayensis]|uniref:Histidine--tRNA ligase n=1 Tax=Paenibacillus hodogayensis TaxID=279208 RepID=A0ABV5VQ81_9BACL
MQNVKGTYDFFGQEQAIRRQVRSVLQDVFECYDFDEMDSTVLNELDLLTSKYAGGDEIVKEMYRFTDQGSRSLGLRYDLTVPFAKVIALNPGIPFPYKRYEIGKVFRDGPVKRGRLREFLQCDADVVGVEGPEAEAELMLLAAEVFRRLDIPITLRWNNRMFLGELLGAMGVAADEQPTVMLTLDKIDKIGKAAVVQELTDKGLQAPVVRAIAEWADMDDPGFEYLIQAYGIGNSKGSLEARALQKLIGEVGLDAVCRFDPFLSRGLSFYTGTVYEIFDASRTFASSLGAGGRYDAIIGKLVGREDIQYPTAGISFGMESIVEMIKNRPLASRQSEVVVIPIGETNPDVLKTAAAFRSNGIRTRLETSGRKLKKSLAAADARGIRYAILIGEEEASAGQIRLKDLKEMTEVVVPMQAAIDRIAPKQAGSRGGER